MPETGAQGPEPAPAERVEAILRRYGVPEADIGACCADLAAHMPPVAYTRDEWGVERRWGMEWGGSVGMSHNDPYTAETVWALCDGRPVYRRTRTVYRDRLSDPTLVTRPAPGGTGA